MGKHCEIMPNKGSIVAGLAMSCVAVALALALLSPRHEAVEYGGTDENPEDTNSQYPNSALTWSSSRCRDLGYAHQFDVCAELEFCESDDSFDSSRREDQRQLRGMLTYYAGGEASRRRSEYETDQDSLYQGGFNTARYGWRIPGQDGPCTWPGPLIRLGRGKKHGLFVKGSGTATDTTDTTVTNLHAHGLHIAGHGNADDVVRRVSGNDVIIYNYTIADYHMGGTFWYHSHAHPNTLAQVQGGAFGMLVVEDGDDVGTEDAGVLAFLKNERILVLSNNVGGEWVANGKPYGDTYALNGGEWYRLRILTVNTGDHQDSQTVIFGEECEVRAIAHDGVFKFDVPGEPKSEYMLTAASRLDVAIRCHAPSEIRVDSTLVATVSVSADPPNESFSPFEINDKQWPSKRPPYLSNLVDSPIDSSWSIHMGETNINDQSYDPVTPLCNGGNDFVFGTLNEWTVRTKTHPLHVHMYHMQIASDDGGCGKIHEYGEYYDTINVIYDYNDHNHGTSCKVRVRFLDVAGKTLLHCHIYRHGDQGSMGFINVIGGPEQPDEPRVHQCDFPPCDEPQVVNQCAAS